MSVMGGLGALVGFALPWFIFVAAVQSGCRAQVIQIEIYDLYGAAIALGQAGSAGSALAVAAVVCAVAIIITAIMSARRLGLFRIRLLVVASLVGMGLLGLLAALVLRGRLAPNGAVLYSVFRVIGFGFWVTTGSLALALVGGAVLHAAARPLRQGAPAGEIMLALLGVVGLLSSITAAVVVRPAPYPSLTCARQATGPLAGGGAVYFTSADGIYALDAATGQVRWRCRNPLGGVVTAGAPTLADGVLFVASRNGYVYAMRAEDAAILWRADIGGRGSTVSRLPRVAPIVADGLVFGVNGAGEVYALRASDGAHAWATTVEPLLTVGVAAPLLGDGALIYPGEGDGGVHVIALDERTGQRRWESPDNAVVYPGSMVPMVLDQGVVYDMEFSAQSSERYLVARSAATGVARWRYALVEPGPQSVPSTFTVANGGVYFELRNQVPPVVMALRTGDGSVMWRAPASDVVSDPGAPAAPLTQLSSQAPELAPTPTPPATPPPQPLTPTPQATQMTPAPQATPIVTPPTTYSVQQAQVTLATDARSVYVAVSAGGAQNTVYRFNARDGAVLWRQDFVHSISTPTYTMDGQPTLTLTDSAVYLLDSSGTAAAFDARTGARRWQLSSGVLPSNWTPVPGAIAGGAAAVSGTSGGQVYVATSSLYTVSQLDGAAHWRFTPDKPSPPYAGTYLSTIVPIISPPTLAP